MKKSKIPFNSHIHTKKIHIVKFTRAQTAIARQIKQRPTPATFSCSAASRHEIQCDTQSSPALIPNSQWFPGRIRNVWPATMFCNSTNRIKSLPLFWPAMTAYTALETYQIATAKKIQCDISDLLPSCTSHSVRFALIFVSISHRRVRMERLLRRERRE